MLLMVKFQTKITRPNWSQAMWIVRMFYCLRWFRRFWKMWKNGECKIYFFASCFQDAKVLLNHFTSVVIGRLQLMCFWSTTRWVCNLNVGLLAQERRDRIWLFIDKKLSSSFWSMVLITSVTWSVRIARAGNGCVGIYRMCQTQMHLSRLGKKW